MATTLRRLVLVTAVAGALIAPATAASAETPGPAVPPGIGVRLLDGPPATVTDPRAHSYIVDRVAPGTTSIRHIGVSNGDAQPIDLSFYAAAATIVNDTFTPGAGHASNDLVSWMTLAPASATIAPGQTVAVAVTIAVPADASAGERYAVALAEHAPAPGGGVTSVSRIGIRVYLSVGPGGAPATAFSIDAMTASRNAGAHPVVTATVRNTGGRAIDLSGKLQLANGPASLSAGPFTTDKTVTIPPGGSGPVTLTLGGEVPSGPWDATITLTSGLTTATATARLTFPAGNATSAAAVTPAGSNLTILLGISALGLLVLVLALILVRRRRRPAQ